MTGILAATNAWPLSSIVITDRTVSRSGIGAITATYTVSNDGTIKNHAGTTLETWLPSGASASSYDVRATFQSGDPVTGTFGSWLNLATSRSWSVTNGDMDNGTLTGIILVEISLTGQATALDSATITLSATSHGA